MCLVITKKRRRRKTKIEKEKRLTELKNYQKEQKQKSIFDTLMFCDTPKKLKQRKLTVRTNDEADIIVDMF